MKSIISLLAVICFLPLFPRGSKAMTPDTTGTAALNRETVARSRVMDVVNTLCDVYGPKPTFSPALARTEAYLENYMKEIGLQNIHGENWDPAGRSWEIRSFQARMTSPYFMDLIACPKMFSPPTKGVIRAEAINLVAGDEKDLEAYRGRLKGKIVLLGPQVQAPVSTRPFVTRMADTTLARLAAMPVPSKEEKLQADREQFLNDSASMQYLRFLSGIIDFCAREGALLTIDHGARMYGTNQVWTAVSTEPATGIFDWYSKSAFTGKHVPIPQVTVSAEQFNSMAGALKLNEKVILEVALDAKSGEGVREKNLIAEIPGTDLKDEVVLIGGHLDGYHQGANAVDNDCGVAACLEAMRAIRQMGARPRRTIRIALWTGEEQGCLGAQSYVAGHFGPGDREKLQAYFNMDNGAGRFRGINCEENTKAQEIFGSWMKSIGDPKFRTTCIRKVDHTDHWRFTQRGLPGFQFIQDPLDYYRIYHTNMDTPERIPVEDMKTNAFLLAAFAWYAANMEGHLQ